MARTKTFVNGGSLLPADLNSIQDDYETAFATYKATDLVGNYRFDAPVAGTFLLTLVAGSGGVGVAASNAAAALAAFYLDPADYLAGARTTKYRIRASAAVNATAPAVTFTVGLYPVSAVAGAAATTSITLGTVVAGSTVAFASPAASSINQSNSGDFTAPASGLYALAAVVSGSAAASSAVAISAKLQYRGV